MRRNRGLTLDIAAEVYDHQRCKGVIKRFKRYGEVKVEDLTICDEDNEYQKPVGRYVLIEPADELVHSELELILTKALRSILRKYKDRCKKVLVVGLGNSSYAPDALGPEVIKRITVTSHLEKRGYKTAVSAFAPGVMADTGLESANMIKAIKEEEGIDLVIAIDALATRKMHRLNRVIQLTDTGLAPGSGIGNNRLKVNFELLGIPVVAIGVATVVDSLSLVAEAIRKVKLDGAMKDQIIESVIKTNDRNLFLATKEIDYEVVEMAKIIAGSINQALL